MSKRTKEEVKRIEVVQQGIHAALLDASERYISVLNTGESSGSERVLGNRVQTLSLAVLALNGIDTYECNG
jgi:hypothetical protein